MSLSRRKENIPLAAPNPDFQRPAAASNALRIHSDLLSPERFMAAIINRFSSGETRACIKIPRNLALGTFGLPIFVAFIKTLRMTKIVVDPPDFSSYD